MQICFTAVFLTYFAYADFSLKTLYITLTLHLKTHKTSKWIF